MSVGASFSGGYQFMRGDSARLERGQPISREGVRGGWVEIVPLTGGRRRVFDVCSNVVDADGNSKATMYIAGDELEARSEFRRLIAELGG